MSLWREKWGFEATDPAPGLSKQLEEDAADWLMDNVVYGDEYPLYVAIRDDKIIAGIGGAMCRWLLPPFDWYVTEFIWWADPDCPKRTVVQMWRLVETWGLINGATRSVRHHPEPEPKGVKEVSHWRRLR